VKLLVRPVKISDEPLLKEFFYSLSETTAYKRFLSTRRGLPHETLQEFFVVIDYTQQMVMLAVIQEGERQIVAGVAQFRGKEGSHTAEVALVVRDEYQNMGIGTELLLHLTQTARRQGLLGFSAEVLRENRVMIHLFEKMGFLIEREILPDVYSLRLGFREA
jgi:ribosomal protein S18 acetylase RimI-like enzyme